MKHRYEVNTNSLIHHGFQTPRRAHVLTNTTADHYNLPLKRKKKQTRTKKNKNCILSLSHTATTTSTVTQLLKKLPTSILGEWSSLQNIVLEPQWLPNNSTTGSHCCLFNIFICRAQFLRLRQCYCRSLHQWAHFVQRFLEMWAFVCTGCRWVRNKWSVYWRMIVFWRFYQHSSISTVFSSFICLDLVRSGCFCVLHDSSWFPTVPQSHPYPITCLQNRKGFGLPVKMVFLFPLL